MHISCTPPILQLLFCYVFKNKITQLQLLLLYISLCFLLSSSNSTITFSLFPQNCILIALFFRSFNYFSCISSKTATHNSNFSLSTPFYTSCSPILQIFSLYFLKTAPFFQSFNYFSSTSSKTASPNSNFLWCSSLSTFIALVFVSVNYFSSMSFKTASHNSNFSRSSSLHIFLLSSSNSTTTLLQFPQNCILLDLYLFLLPNDVLGLLVSIQSQVSSSLPQLVVWK